MSKGGGAGKVYFVLYLAVVLELLIIIVERDEAEEGLHKKQQETMKIVESILSQLQSGAGTEGINTRPQDEITIPPPGVNIKEIMGADIKSSRKYIVEVGVTDVTAAIKRREGETDKEHNQRLRKLVELANVSELQYQIFYNPSPDANTAPMFPDEKTLKTSNTDFMKMEPGARVTGPNGEEWEMIAVRQINMDNELTYNSLNPKVIKTTADIIPIYPREKEVTIGPWGSLKPNNLPDDSTFFYSDYESRKSAGIKGQDLQKRSFVINFQPPNRAGWYKLRFVSKTNKILGVRADQKAKEMGDDATVNIGTVQLTVGALYKVQKELAARLEKYALPSTDAFIKNLNIDEFDRQMQVSVNKAMEDPNSVEVISKLRLYSYIAKLLAPGMSSNFDHNKGSIEFNVRVILPKPQMSQPTISSLNAVQAGFDALPHVFEFAISPYQANSNIVSAVVKDAKGATVAGVRLDPLYAVASNLAQRPTANGGKIEYRAVVDKKLPPGAYKIEVNHKIGTRAATPAIADLYMFKTGLTNESASKLNARINSYGFYGNPLVLDVIPESGSKITANQFRIYANFDNGSQKPPIEGLSITNENALKFTPDANKLTLKVTWVQPYTGTEVDIYPSKTFTIRQEEPTVNTRGMQISVSGNTNKPKVTITGIKVSKPFTGTEKDAQIKVRLGEFTKANGLTTYQVASGPTIDGDPENGYSITFELGGKLPPGTTKIKGTGMITVYAKAINPVNGKSSDEVSQQIQIPIDWEPERGGQRRR